MTPETPALGIAPSVAGDRLPAPAWAYMLRTEKNADLIAEIEGGIKKEVSVGCSVGRRVCSVCGEPVAESHVRLQQGETVCRRCHSAYSRGL